jgi:glutamate dehydrogenase
MLNKKKQRKQKLIQETIDLAAKSDFGKNPSFDFFISTFYQFIPQSEIIYMMPEQLLAWAHHAWNFAQKKSKNTPTINIFVPTFEKDGWESNDIFIEIINCNMPFLVDSISAALARFSLISDFNLHPVFQVKRGNKGQLQDIRQFNGITEKGFITESVMFIKIEAQPVVEQFDIIKKEMLKVLLNVHMAVDDWHSMLIKVKEVSFDIEKVFFKSHEEIDEVKDFLYWLEQDHFTFLGYREYDYINKAPTIIKSKEGALGILRDKKCQMFEHISDGEKIPDEVAAFLNRPDILMINKANIRSLVHRNVHLDVIGIKKFDAQGKVIGEHQFVGLLTSVAYHQNPDNIPICRVKTAYTFDKAGFAQGGHDGKSLTHILNTFPRDDLFQISKEELFEITMGILDLQDRPQTALFLRPDAFGRFISCYVYVPRERYDVSIREKIISILEDAFKGEHKAYYLYLTNEVMARLHIIIKTVPGKIPEYDALDIQSNLIEACKTWVDLLYSENIAIHGVNSGIAIHKQFSESFPISYQLAFDPKIAVQDIGTISDLFMSDGFALNLYRLDSTPKHLVKLKLYNYGLPIYLSDVLPMIEGMGLRVVSEVPYEIKPRDIPQSVWMHDFILELHTKTDTEINIEDIKERFESAFIQLWYNKIENDNFNRLVIYAGLRARDATIIRAYYHYLKQLGIVFSQSYIEDVFVKFPHITKKLIDFFHVKFDPEEKKSRKSRCDSLCSDIEGSLDEIKSIEEDKILRKFLNLIQATQRVNYYQGRSIEKRKPYLSFKIKSALVDDMPSPKPLYEVFVYSPEMEGVHLRGGKVARGGIRWSDRREDFRTEVLGLMKAQLTKNSLIVPTGSKGGFIVKKSQPSRDEVITCYKMLMKGLLDITDNLKDGKVIPPKNTVRYDDDDPYLVVAADKGTATFSDIANSISADYDFWLGDAFASGGSAGYDHKKMGITAKGAWESVKRHFRELDINTQETDFSVIGIGDMGGDVFGNGMLLSEHIKLIGAFNHEHIFFDPNPDPAKSFVERQRLFDLPRSKWSDYNAKLISKGGGIFSRADKSIPVSREMADKYGISGKQISPVELMKAMLTSHVDLLWFGGIGTYIKASSESDADAGDRANDSIRVDAKNVKAWVIGEGANLGVTQLGRIEFALRGGKINSDSIDNAGGVNCSDHEVNIKILLNNLISKGALTLEKRNKLLVDMTDHVSALVLKENYLQTQALTLAERQGVNKVNILLRLIRFLEKSELLNRELEYLPDDETIEERRLQKKSFVRPELSVLLAYSKILLKNTLAEGNFADDSFFDKEISDYFPAQLQKNFSKEVCSHSLRNEIIITHVTNNVINRCGMTFVIDMMEKAGANADDVVRSYVVTEEIFGLRTMYEEVDQLDYHVPVSIQINLFFRIKQLQERICLWLLSYCTHPLKIVENIDFFKQGVTQLSKKLISLLDDNDQERLNHRYQEFINQGVPELLAKKIANLSFINASCDIIRIAHYAQLDPLIVGNVYFKVGNIFHLRWLRQMTRKVEVQNHWEAKALSNYVEEFYTFQSLLTLNIVPLYESSKDNMIDVWVENNKTKVQQLNELIKEMRTHGHVDLPMLVVVNNHLQGMLRNDDIKRAD